jgi:GTP-dependent phosphoenolpyruvate carboxykinase
MVNQRPVNAIIKFITSFSSPEEVLVFKPSTESQERLTELLYEQNLRHLTPEEHRELDYFMIVEHIMCTARFEAQERLAA